MGTRHLTMVVKNGEYILAQYGQWDGYPEGQGNHALMYLNHQFDEAKLLAGLALSYKLTLEQLDAEYVKCGAEPGSRFVNMNVVDKFKALHPCLSRDVGADIMRMVQIATEPFALKHDLEFAASSLFCEWAYVIDLDKRTFEVYEGFNKSPLTEEDRFFFLMEKIDKEDKYKYYPGKLKKSYSLDALPTSEVFLRDFKEPDEDGN